MPKRDDINKVMIISSGPIIIGQACEFDYSGTQACKALRKLGYEIVLANSNPATIMTDPGMAEATYIEALNVRTMTEIIEKERPDALLPNLGGQTGLNLSSELAETGVLENTVSRSSVLRWMPSNGVRIASPSKPPWINWALKCPKASLPSVLKKPKKLPISWDIPW